MQQCTGTCSDPGALQALQPRQEGGQGGQTPEERAKSVLDDLLERLPELFDLEDIRSRIDELTPYIMVAIQVAPPLLPGSGADVRGGQGRASCSSPMIAWPPSGQAACPALCGRLQLACIPATAFEDARLSCPCGGGPVSHGNALLGVASGRLRTGQPPADQVDSS